MAYLRGAGGGRLLPPPPPPPRRVTSKKIKIKKERKGEGEGESRRGSRVKVLGGLLGAWQGGQEINFSRLKRTPRARQREAQCGWGPGARLRAPGGVQGQSPCRGSRGRSPRKLSKVSHLKP